MKTFVLTENANEAKEFIATLMGTVSLSIITTPKIPSRPARSKVSWTEPDGIRMISNG